MKKIIIVICVILVIVVGILVVNGINIGNNSNIEEVSTNKNKLVLKFEGVNITPGEKIVIDDIKAKPKVSTITSCAFEGKDHVYSFNNVEITANIRDKEEIVYSVYFVDDTFSTPEGIKIGSSKKDLIDKLGNNYEEDSSIVKYNYDGVVGIFEISNDSVFSIEYQMELK